MQIENHEAKTIPNDLETLNKNGVFLNKIDYNNEFTGEEAKEKLKLHLKLNLKDSIYEEMKKINFLEADFPFFYYFPFCVANNKELIQLFADIIEEELKNEFSTCLLGVAPKQIFSIYKKGKDFNKIFSLVKEEENNGFSNSNENNDNNNILFNLFTELISLKEKQKGFIPNFNLNNTNNYASDEEEINPINNKWFINFENPEMENLNLSNRKRLSPDEAFEINENEQAAEEEEPNKNKNLKKKKIEKIYLPKINEIKIIECFADAVSIEASSVNRKMLKEKNKHVFCFEKTTKDLKLSYLVYMLNPLTEKFEFKAEFPIEEENKESIQSENQATEECDKKPNKSFKQMRIDNLHENKLYFLKIFTKFDDFISAASDNFCIHTSFTKGVCESNKNSNSENSITYYKKFEEAKERKFIKFKLHESNYLKNEDFLLSEIELNVEEFLKANTSNICDFYMSNDKIEFLTNNSDLILLAKLSENYSATTTDLKLNEKSTKLINIQNKNNNNNNNFDNNSNSPEEKYKILSTEKAFNYISAASSKLNFLKIPIIQASMGSDFILALDCSGSVYSWGSNYFGQLGINLDYKAPELTFPKKINFNSLNEKENIFIFKIATTKFSCLALGIKNGKQKLFNWGLGCGSDHLDASEKSLVYAEVFMKQNANQNVTIINKSNVPIAFGKIDSSSIVKIIGGKDNFIILCNIKNNENDNNKENKNKLLEKENFYECFFYGFYKTCGFLMDFKFKKALLSSDCKDEFMLHKSDFFKLNYLSVIDAVNGDDFVIFLVRNNAIAKNELYAVGKNLFGECGLIEQNYFTEPTKIKNKILKNPIQIKQGKDYTFVLVKQEADNNDEKGNLIKSSRRKLVRIGCNKAKFYGESSMSDVKSDDDLFDEISLPDELLEKEIIKVDCFLDDSLFLIIK